jgi:hypothetical protein
MSEPFENSEQLPVAYRYDFDGYGYRYIDSGSGSDWKTRAKDAEPLYTKQPTNAEPVTWATEDLEDVMSPRFRQMHKDIKSSTWRQFPIPLYTHPMRELTDEEIIELMDKHINLYLPDYAVNEFIAFARAVRGKK